MDPSPAPEDWPRLSTSSSFIGLKRLLGSAAAGTGVPPEGGLSLVASPA